MILHYFPYEKFTQDYINRINKLFNPQEHIFWVYGNKGDSAIRAAEADNIIFENNISGNFNKIFQLYMKILEADKVIIHSLFFATYRLLFFRVVQVFNAKKFFWNIWGADLYNEYWKKDKNFKKKLREKIKKGFIKRLKAVGYIRGDYDFLLEHYNTNAKFYIASYSYDFFSPMLEINDEDKESINILLGNSATEECQYDEVIDILAKYKDMPIKVKCILSYPIENSEYREKVIKHGKAVLKEKFEPIVDFITYEKYMALLAGIDIAIFNHNRQQALGNIASLLYLGKRVYINSANACKSYFEDMGAIVYSINDLREADICKNNSNELNAINKRAIDEFFSDEKFKQRWENIFEERY